jgi:hypothetical protein
MVNLNARFYLALNLPFQNSKKKKKMLGMMGIHLSSRSGGLELAARAGE